MHRKKQLIEVVAVTKRGGYSVRRLTTDINRQEEKEK
jgi:hypothetical protein